MSDSKVKKLYLIICNEISQNHLQPDLAFLAFEQNTPKTYFTIYNDGLWFNYV